MEETKRSGMSKDQFWNLIEKAQEVCGTDLDASAVWIKQQLFYMTPEDVLQFHNLVYPPVTGMRLISTAYGQRQVL